jgi:hypothetical protein
MTDAPEKLWVLPLWGQDYPQDCRVSEEKEDDDSQEYIRKDISDAPNSNIKALCDQLAKVSIERTNAYARVKELERALKDVVESGSNGQSEECYWFAIAALMETNK